MGVPIWTPHAAPPGAPFGGQRGIVDKDLHKLIVRQWQEPRAVLMYILQDRFVAPLAAAVAVAVSRQPEVYFHAFMTAWVMLLEVGGEDGGALSQTRQRIITTKLKQMPEDLSFYMREHYNSLIYNEAAVRRRVIHAAKRDLLELSAK